MVPLAMERTLCEWKFPGRTVSLHGPQIATIITAAFPTFRLWWRLGLVIAWLGQADICQDATHGNAFGQCGFNKLEYLTGFEIAASVGESMPRAHHHGD